MKFLVIHDAGSHEGVMVVHAVESTSAMGAARKVHKKAHGDIGAYEYYVAPLNEVVVIRAEMPQEAVFTVTTSELERMKAL